MIILSIETSCDETAVAIAEFKGNSAGILANVVSSKIKLHSKYGGVVTSLAARMHLKNIIPVLTKAFKNAKTDKSKVDYIAITNGPGLIPALMIGTQATKTLSYALNKPLIPINHIEGHIYANWLKEFIKSKVHKVHKVKNDFKLWNPEFPILCLIVSGGHTQLVLMKKDLDYKIIGETLDDAAGEAFDKTAKLLNLGYPGGPLIEKLAKRGNEKKFDFPRPMINSNDYNFSFSGLKTAVLHKIYGGSSRNETLPRSYNYNNQYKADIAASFQQAVIDVLVSKTIKAAREYKVKNIILGGGVSANKELQRQFCKVINDQMPNAKCQMPNSNLSTDNALMIAIAAHYHVVNSKGIKSWRDVKADANLEL